MADLMWMLLGPAGLGASFGYTRRFISPLGIVGARRPVPPPGTRATGGKGLSAARWRG